MERDRVDALQLGRAIHELRLALGLHERPEHEERRIRQQRVVLVGAQHPVDEPFAIATAAGRHQQERLVRDLRQARRSAARSDFALQVAGVDHLLAHALRQGDAFERITDLRQSIHPYFVVELAQRGNRFLALPFRLEKARLVHHVTQAQDDACVAALERLQGLQQLAAQAHGLLIDDEDVRIELFGGVLDDRSAHRHRLADVQMQIERGVLAVPQLDHAGHAHEVDARAEIEAADDRRARKDEDRELLEILDEGMRDRAAATQMAEAKRVVAVDQDAAIVPPGPHGVPLGSPILSCPGGRAQALLALHALHTMQGRKPFTGLRQDHVRSTRSSGRAAASSALGI